MSDRKEYWQQHYQKLTNEKLIFIHPGTGGSSGCVPVEKLVQLMINVDQQTQSACHFILTFNG
ncbi:hypothetical protein, partial [Psychrobacter sp. GW64-MNA-CIBAN-0177]